MNNEFPTRFVVVVVSFVVLVLVGIFAYTTNQGYERDQVIRIKCVEAGGVWVSPNNGQATCQWGRNATSVG